MKKILALSLIFLAFWAQTTLAQGHFGINFTLGFPQNQFRQATDAVGAGVNLNAMFPLFKKSPIFVGFDLGYQVYGYRSYRQNLNAQILANGQVIGSVPMNFQITHSNNLFNGHAVIRLKAPLKYVQPYVDGYVGFKNLYTRTTIEDLSNVRYNSNNTTTRNIVNSRTNIADWALSFGYGGGLMFNISDVVSVDLKVIMLKGGEARFYDRESTSQWTIQFQQGAGGVLEPISGTNNLTVKTSTTDMLFGQLGLTFHIGS